MLARLISAICTGSNLLLSYKYTTLIRGPYTLILILMTRGCNIGIWKKFQSRSVAALHQQNRDLQNKRLTKTIVLLFVSGITLLAWLPLVTLNFSIIVCFFRVRMKFYYMINNCQSSTLCIKNSRVSSTNIGSLLFQRRASYKRNPR